MLNLYSISLFSLVLLTLIPYNAFGAFDETPISLTWNSSTGPTNAAIFDADGDGIADNLYDVNTSGLTVTLTKIIGNGVTSPTALVVPSGTIKWYSTDGPMFYVASYSFSGSDCVTRLSSIDITTGTATPTEFTHNITVSGTATAVDSMLGVTYNGHPTIISHCDGTDESIEMYNPTDGVIQSVTGLTGTVYYFQSDVAIGAGPSGNFNVIDAAGNLFPVTTTSLANFSLDTGICNFPTTSACLSYDGAELNKYSPPSITFANNNIVPIGAKMYVGAVDVTPKRDVSQLLKNELKDFFKEPPTTQIEQISTMSANILGIANYQNIVTMPYYDGTDYYVLWLRDAQVDYANVNALVAQNRAYVTMLVDDFTSPDIESVGTLSWTSHLGSVSVKKPDTTYTHSNSIGFTVPSGYIVQPTAIVDRKFTPVIADLGQRVFYDTPTSSLTQLSFIVKNSPVNAGVMVTDTATTLGEQNIFALSTLEADNSFNVDMPTAACGKIWIRDLETMTPWEYLGDLCAAGAMPKYITYLSSLSFTFWSLPWGASHVYDQETQLLKTYVRHDIPYSYDLEVYDKDNNLVIEKTITKTPISSMLTPNTDIVPYSGYTVFTDTENILGFGSGSAGSRSFFQYEHDSRIRQNDDIEQVKIKTAANSNHANLSAFYIDIWRPNGSNFDRIAQSENILSSITTPTTLHTVNLATPLAVEEGDYLGYTITSSSNVGQVISKSLGEITNAGYFCDCVPSATNFNWLGQSTTPDYYARIQALGQAPSIIFIGDSITAGHPDHYSIIENASTTNKQSSPPFKTGQLLNVSYQNMGIGGSNNKSGDGLARFTNDVVNLKPKMVIIGYGTSDINNSVSLATFSANMQSMITTSKSNGIEPVLHKIYPRDYGTLGVVDTKDTNRALFNDEIISLGNSNNILVIDHDNTLGDNQIPLGIEPSYDSGDNVHFNENGDQAIADRIYSSVNAGYTITSEESGLDIQLLDMSSVALPAKLIIKQSGNILYTANAGYPSYLSSIGAFFNQYFTIDGFNILFLMPIIFGAMFTRNSVGIGTGMTVVFIGTLSWFGLIVIPESVFLLMVFIAILGMIAYRYLR